jgi:hypothetical protein
LLDVFLTVDVEVWCDGWDNIDAKFADCFRKYVYGPTPRGDYGLPHQLKVLREHGLTGVFFTEPLFATRFGMQPLAEIVGLLKDGGADVQLHLHPEWVNEAHEPVLPGVKEKIPSLRRCTLEQQQVLVATGLKLLTEAGAGPLNAFRAGGFGLNRDTLRALAHAGVRYDSSYNASMGGLDCGVAPGTCVLEPLACDGVIEVPMTNYDDGSGRLRHAQITACSWSEMEGLLWQAAEQERQAFVVLWHNFELLNPAKNRADDVMVRRFDRLCQFLDRHRDSFRVRGFAGYAPALDRPQPQALRSPRWKTGLRMAEQLYRRRWR